MGLSRGESPREKGRDPLLPAPSRSGSPPWSLPTAAWPALGGLCSQDLVIGGSVTAGHEAGRRGRPPTVPLSPDPDSRKPSSPGPSPATSPSRARLIHRE